jgi:hypothetical protein
MIIDYRVTVTVGWQKRSISCVPEATVNIHTFHPRPRLGGQDPADGVSMGIRKWAGTVTPTESKGEKGKAKDAACWQVEWG